MSRDARQLQRIAVFGQGESLWPILALLQHELPENVDLVAVEDFAVPAPAALSVRLDDPFLARLGLDAATLFTPDSAVPALGTWLQDWQGDGHRFFWGGSDRLPTVDDLAIHQIMLRAAVTYDQPDRLAYLYQPFRLPARAAESGKFALQSHDLRSPLTLFRPVVQMDTADFAALMKSRCPAGRVEILSGRPVAVHGDPESDAIAEIRLEDGRAIAADLFIDVSGYLGRLWQPRQGPSWHSLTGLLPFDRLLSARLDQTAAMPDRSAVAQAVEGGLLVTTPLRSGAMVQYAYQSSLLTESDARAMVTDDAAATPLVPGFDRQPWTGNLLRLGAASASFGPFLSPDLTLLLRQARLFADHLPAGAPMSVEAREFNRRQRIAAEHIRDYSLLPFALSRRTDSFWAGFPDICWPDQLAIRLAQFRSRGRYVAFEEEVYDEQSWIDLMIGFGVVPERFDPLVRAVDMPVMARRLKKLTSAFDQTLAAMEPADFFFG